MSTYFIAIQQYLKYAPTYLYLAIDCLRIEIKRILFLDAIDFFLIQFF